MSPRRSKTGVKYLQYDHGYLIYAHPVYIKKHGKPFRIPSKMTLKEAQQLAISANIENDAIKVSRILHDSEKFSALIELYRVNYLPFKDYSKGSISNIKNQLNRLRADLGELATIDISIKQVAEYLDSNHVNDAYKKHRARLVDIFAYGLHKGECSSNPAAETLPVNMKSNAEKQRQRLKEDGFNAIYVLADQWFKNAMDLSVITLQARQEISSIRRKSGTKNIYYTDPPQWFGVKMNKLLGKGKDWTDTLEDNHIYIIRGKTAKSTDRAFIKIKLDGIEGLKDAIARCKDDIASPYLVHRRPSHKRSANKKHWTQVLPKYLSDEFSRLRDLTGMYDDLEPLEKPSFHEIRSYGADRLEMNHGKEFVNWLLGHTKMRMSEHYLDGHRVRWIESAEQITGK